MKRLLSWVTAMAALIMISASLTLPATAAEYPSKPISLIMPYPAGGSTDITGRALVNAAKRYLGQPIIIDNKPGAGGTVGPSLVVSKPPDGYTIGIMPSQAVASSWHMGKLNFNPLDDVTHIIRYCGYLHGLVVRADSPWKTIQDFIKYSKENPQQVTYGTTGAGGGPHLAMEQLALLTGVQWIHMPYKGNADTNAALLGGHLDSVSASSGWAPLVDAGKFRLLATYGLERSVRYPQVPTLREIGYDVISLSPLEVMGPKGLPKPIVKKLHDAFKKAMDDPEYQAVLNRLDMWTVYLSSEDLEKMSRVESEQQEKSSAN